MLDQMKSMKDALINCVQNQISGNLEKVEAKELGEAIDMIKDLSKAIYYCTITEAMEEKDEQKSRSEVMYYDGRGGQSSMTSGGRRVYPDSYPSYPMLSAARDGREGRSPMYRKMYMENKMMHDKNKSMQDLDDYMQELTSDLVDMVQDASPEEKQLLQ